MTALESATKDLRAYLAANPTPDPKLVALLTGVIERAGAAAPVEPGVVPPAVDLSPQKSTAHWLAQATADEYARLGQQEAADILAKPRFDREAYDAERKIATRSLILGTDGTTKIDGSKS